jgi:hypothetical protein
MRGANDVRTIGLKRRRDATSVTSAQRIVVLPRSDGIDVGASARRGLRYCHCTSGTTLSELRRRNDERPLAAVHHHRSIIDDGAKTERPSYAYTKAFSRYPYDANVRALHPISCSLSFFPALHRLIPPPSS